MRERMGRSQTIRFGMTVAALGIGFVSTPSLACPSCPVGQTARKQVFEQDFATNAAAGVLPFLVVGLVAKRAERIGRSRSSVAEDEA